MTAPSRSDSANSWLHGPAADWILGYGLAYALALPLLLGLPHLGGPAAWPPAALYLLAVLVSGPHYGATLLRVLEGAGDRQRYRRVTLGATLLAGGWLALALTDARAGSLLVSAYVYWSPWHFGGQNFGLALLSLRRRGVAVDGAARRWLHASFVISVLLAALGLNTASVAALQSLANEGTYPLVRILLEPALAARLAVLLAIGWLTAAGAFVARQLRSARVSQLAPALALVGCQALWFGVPALLMVQGRSGALGLAFATAWISAAHAVQYLWITSYAARTTDSRAAGRTPYLVRATLAGSLYLVVPGLLLAPLAGDGLAWETGLAVLVVSAVNVHHFLLDGAIWKLREGPVARVLLRGPAKPESPRMQPSWGKRLAGAAGAVCFLFSLAYVHENTLASDPDAPTGRLETAARRLDWLGRASPRLHARIGRRRSEAGDVPGAIEAFERSLALTPSAEAWAGLAGVRERAGDWRGASAAWREARALDGDDGALLRRSLRFEARRSGAADPEGHARAALERMHRERPGAVAPARALARDLSARGEPSAAVEVLRRTLAQAPPGRRAGLVLDLAELLDGPASAAPAPTLRW